MQDTLFSQKINVIGPIDFPTSLKANISMQNNSLSLSLSHLNNTFQLYICQISQSDFLITKKEQGIKVDFQSFIRTLLSYFHNLGSSMTCYISYLSKTEDYSKPDRKSDDSVIKMSLVENDTFKNITRLELLFYKPSEIEFRKYLGDSLKKYESDNIKLIRETTNLRERLKENEKVTKNKIEMLERELNEMAKKSDRLYRENLVLADEKKEETEKMCQKERKIAEIENKLAELEIETEKQKIWEIREEKNKKRIDDLENRIEKYIKELEDRNEMLIKIKEEKREIERSYKEKELKYEEMRNEMRKLKKEKEDRKIKMKEKEDAKNDLEIALEAYKNRIKDIEKENNELKRKLENAQSVYNHFYNKKIGNDSNVKSEDTSLFDSVEPESPPHKL